MPILEKIDHLADARATHGPSMDSLALERLLRRVGDILHWRFASPPETRRRLINGHELMAALELSPGPLVGRLLEAVEEAHALGQVNTPEEALAHAASLVQHEVAVSGPREAQ